MKKEGLHIQVLPSPAAVLRAASGVDEAELSRLVKERVEEIMAERDALVLEPFFRSRQIAYELKRLQTVPEQEKWATCYERYGCLDCKTKDRPHAGTGMCTNCKPKWCGRLAQIIAEGVEGALALPARGTPRAEQRRPDGLAVHLHHTWKTMRRTRRTRRADGSQSSS